MCATPARKPFARALNPEQLPSPWTELLQISHRHVAITATAFTKMFALSSNRGAQSILPASDATLIITGPWVPSLAAVGQGWVKATLAMKLENPGPL